jgi:O-6-methylguanine DNA methyltransferase
MGLAIPYPLAIRPLTPRRVFATLLFNYFRVFSVKALTTRSTNNIMLKTPPVHITFTVTRQVAQLQYAVLTVPSGHKALVAYAEEQLCFLGFTTAVPCQEALRQLQATWPKATLEHTPKRVTNLFKATRTATQPVVVAVNGTPFQLKVWQALLAIPSGQTTHYQALAKQLGQPTANRAVGNAVGKNPVSWFIPCHRVLQKSGELGGYRWGLAVKQALLQAEASTGYIAAK